MSPRKKDMEEEPETWFYVQIVDAGLGKIRFGPFSLTDENDVHETEESGEDIAANLRADIGSNGLQKALENRHIWGAFEVWLIGEDGTRINVWEVEAP